MPHPFRPARSPVVLGLLVGLVLVACHASIRAADEPGAAPPAPPPEGTLDVDGQKLTFKALMDVGLEARKALILKLPKPLRQRFMEVLTEMQRTVVLTDPEDCSGTTRLKRQVAATGELADEDEDRKRGFFSQLAKRAVRAVPGAGLAIGAAQVNEERKDIQDGASFVEKTAKYQDVCDMPEEAKLALLTSSLPPGWADTRKDEKSLLDKASSFLGR